MTIMEWLRNYLNLIRIMIFRDIRAIYILIAFQIRMFWLKRKNKVLLYFFDENVHKFSNKTAIFYKDETHTFNDVANLANKISNWIESSLQLGRDEQWELFHKVSVIENTPNVDDKQKNAMNKHAQTDEIKQQIDRKLDEHLQSTQIGLMFGNVPEMASFLIGVARVRCSSVLFNVHHRGDTLINAFRCTNCQAFIFEAKFADAIKDVAEHLPDIKFFMYDRNINKRDAVNVARQIDFYYNGLSRKDLLDGTGFEEARKFSILLDSYPTTPVRKNYPYQMNDMIQYVFTSGTTGGNIKAAPTDNVRLIASYLAQSSTFGVNHRDNIYICLPLYHSFAGIIGLCYMYAGGSTLTLVEKFSASKFWSDCCKYKCTVALYIGELCRYLLAQKPVKPEEQQHSLRIMIGLGLKKEIWSEFQERFNIKQICEYYGSTEGNIQTFNLNNKKGSCGFIPYYYGILTKLLFHIFLIKVDPVTMELVRDKRGLCVFAKPGEDGMLVGDIRNGIFAEFLGYTSKKESSKKIVRNVRRFGDCAFVSGDLMVMDFYGNLFFKDRTGDTFRWKGENVSTTEIETIVEQYFQHKDCVIYGVEVPKSDGRAGMMAISGLGYDDLDFDEFYCFMKSRAPDYAIPKFIRITDQIQTTSTLKYLKFPLREAGFDLTKMQPEDRLFYFDRSIGKYLPLDKDAYDRILNGQIQIS